MAQEQREKADAQVDAFAEIQAMQKTPGWQMLEERILKGLDAIKREMVDLSPTKTERTTIEDGRITTKSRPVTAEEHLAEYYKLQGRHEGLEAIFNEIKSIERKGKKALKPKPQNR